MKLTYKHTKYACYLGYVTQSLTTNLPPLLFAIFRQQFGISYEQLGRLILINFLIQLTMDFLAGMFADKIGMRLCSASAHLFCAVGLIFLGVLPQVMTGTPYLALIIADVFYAIGAGLIEVLISPTLDSLPGEGKPSSMALLHSFYCWGQAGVVLLSTIYIFLTGSEKWYILPIVWSLLPLFNLFLFSKVPMVPPIAEDKLTSLKEIFSSKTLILCFIIMVGAGASELSMSQWASMFAERGLGISKITGDLLGPCLFAVLMGTTRVFGGKLTARFPLTNLLIASCCMCLCCYALTTIFRSPVLNIIGCAFCGISVALMWPTTLSYAADKYPNGGTRMFSILAAFGDVGCSAGPWLSGLVSDIVQRNSGAVAKAAGMGLSMEELGIKSGLMAAAVFPTVMLICLLLLKNSTSKIKK